MIAAINYFSKWPEVATCSSVTSGAATVFELSVRLDSVSVEEIVTDNGSQFTSFKFKANLKALIIQHSLVALYLPQFNSEVKLFNRLMIAAYRSGGQSGVHQHHSSHVGGIPNNATGYDRSHAGVSDTLKSVYS